MIINHIKSLIDKIFIAYNDLDEESTELNYVNDFTLLIAIILSAQCTDKMVNKVTKDIFQNYNNPKDFRNLSLSEIENLIKRLNFYKTKAKNIYMLSKILAENEIPKTLHELMQLPGVGVKTASVFLSETKIQEIVAIDTHLFRVFNRIGFLKSKKRETMARVINDLTENRRKSKLHHIIINHGRNVCTARKPKCHKCNISEICESYQIFEKEKA